MATGFGSVVGSAAVVKSEHAGRGSFLHPDLKIGYKRPMAKYHTRGEIDEVTRDRIVAWIRYEMHKRAPISQRQFALKIGVSHAYLSRTLSGAQRPGLELLTRLHRRLHVSADRMLDEDPPAIK